MRKLTILIAAAITVLVFALPASATIINLDGRANTTSSVSELGTKAVIKHFGPGTYNVSFVQDEFTAFTRWNSVTGCDTAGENCVQGWENSAYFSIGSGAFTGSNVYHFGDNVGLGGYGPVPVDAYFATPGQSLAHAAMYSQQFTLASPEDVYFFIHDHPTSDNHGGVSLLITAVPEPASWLVLGAGVGLIGLLMFRRRGSRMVS